MRERLIFVSLTVAAVVLLATSTTVVVAGNSSSPSDRQPVPFLVNNNQNQKNQRSNQTSGDEVAPTPLPPFPGNFFANFKQQKKPPVGSGYINDQGMYISGPNKSENTVLVVGYLTAIKGDLRDKQGLAVSGAMTMALDDVSGEEFLCEKRSSLTLSCPFQINDNPNILPNVTLAMRWNDTRGETVLATKAITEMICDEVATIFGPEGNCYVEGIVTQSRNIPMLSYVSPLSLFFFNQRRLFLTFVSIFRNAPTTRPPRFQRSRGLSRRTRR